MNSSTVFTHFTCGQLDMAIEKFEVSDSPQKCSVVVKKDDHIWYESNQLNIGSGKSPRQAVHELISWLVLSDEFPLEKSVALHELTGAEGYNFSDYHVEEVSK